MNSSIQTSAAVTMSNAASASPTHIDGPFELPRQRSKDRATEKEPSENASAKTSSASSVSCSSSSAIVRIRKQLGSRRDDSDLMDSDDEEHAIATLAALRALDAATTTAVVGRKLIFTSPRCIVKDEEIFPTDHSPYRKSDERWNYISDQAGSHRQDGTTITIGRKLTPKALRIGMTKHAASRVRCLDLWLDHDKDILPEWLDVIAHVFVNLEHLNLTEDIFPGEDEMAVSSRMRRLYILYRLPYLKSIDDKVVTSEERQIARPTDPNGNRVIKSEWVGTHDSIIDEDDDIAEAEDQHQQPTDQDDDDVGQMPTIPATMSYGGVKTAKELGVEINQELAAKVAALNLMSTITTDSDMTTTITVIEKFDVLGDKLVGKSLLSDIDINRSETTNSSCLPKVNRIEVREDIEVYHDLSIGRQSSSCTQQWDAVEVDLTGSVKQRHYFFDSNAGISIGDKETHETGRNSKQVSRIRSMVHDSSEGSIELVSVASTDLEWSAACGVLSFRSDRGCAPRLRLPYYSRKHKQVGVDNCVAGSSQATSTNVNSKQGEKENATEKPCPSVPRQSNAVNTPQVGCCAILASGSSQCKFFPISSIESRGRENVGDNALSANKQMPPSKSLSSPFPMQFRDRQKTPPTTQLATDAGSARLSKSRITEESQSRSMDTISNPALITSLSSPRQANQTLKAASKGDLPPPCPAGSRRKVVVANTTKARKSKRRLRELKASKENARCTSVMDLDDEDNDSDANEESDDEDVLVVPIPHFGDEDSLSYSET